MLLLVTNTKPMILNGISNQVQESLFEINI
jgi:hypothetical protein